MKEHPILFSAPMIRALRDGKKTQTRRLVTHRNGVSFLGGKGDENDPECWGWSFDGPDHHGYEVIARGLNERHDHGRISMRSPYGEPGDRLWVRETWAPQPGREDSIDLPEHDGGGNPDALCFRADECRPGESAEWPEGLTFGVRKWRPSIFLPRWGSRMSLAVTVVRVERLQDITEADARAEGTPIGVPMPARINGEPGQVAVYDPVRAYALLWDGINGKRAPWASNPWVWVVEFKVGSGAS